MKRYEEIWCSNEYADTPKWIDVELSDLDRERVKIGREFLKQHKGEQVRFQLDGKLDWSEDFDAKVRLWQLIVTPYSVWVGFSDDWTNDSYECEVE